MIADPVLVFAQEFIDLETERVEPTVQVSPTPQQAAISIANTATASAAVKEVPQPNPSASSNLSELFYQVQLVQQEVMQLRGQLEDQSHEIRQLKQQSLERYVDLDRRLSEAGVVVNTPSRPGNSASRPAAQEVAGEGDAYRAAYSLVRSQKFKEAVNAFKQFLDDFPSGRYAANAHYWLGELYLVITPRDLESSRQSFVLLLEQYPGNSKEPDALYKLAKVYFQKGNADRAKDYLDRVIAEYGASTSSAVKLARDFIAENY